MASVCDYARAKLKIDEETRPSAEGMYGPLTLDNREIYYEKSGEEYYPQILFSYGDETLQLKRGNMIYELTVRNQFELEAVLPSGDITWFKGTQAPYEGCGELQDGGHYTSNYHESEDLYVRVFDKGTGKIIEYKVIKESEKPMTPWEEEHFFGETKTTPEETLDDPKPLVDDDLPF